MLWVQSSRVGLSYADFWKMTPNEWSAWMEGYMLREEDEWRRTRSLYSLIYNVNVDRRHQLKPEELMPLPGDKQTEQQGESGVKAKYLTDEERAVLKARYKLH